MKTNCKTINKKIFFIVPISFILFICMIVSIGTTLGKYSETIDYDVNADVEIPIGESDS